MTPPSDRSHPGTAPQTIGRGTALPEALLDPAIRRLCGAIAAGPEPPRHVAIVAPGGYGKTAVLAEVTAAYRRAGLLVVGTAEAITDLAGREPAALGVDDAHRLGEPQLEELRALAEAGQVPLTVAYRPWPRPPALTALVDVLSRAAPPLVLAPLDRARAAALLATVRGSAAADELVDFVYAQTGGVPRLVDRLATLTNGTVPESAVLAFRHDIDQLDDDVQRFLLAAEAGAGRHLELLGGLLGRLPDERADHEAVADVMAAARATGLIGRDGALLPIGRRAVAALVPAERRVAVRQRLAELQLDAGGPVLGLAGGLLDTGVAGAGMAAVFRAAAAEATADRPALAARCYAAAVASGARIAELGAAWADAAARAGDLDLALRLADQLITAPPDAVPPADRATAMEVAAAALAHRGELGRSADLNRWAGTPTALAFAATALLATGRPTPQEQPEPPTHTTGTADTRDRNTGHGRPEQRTRATETPDTRIGPAPNGPLLGGGALTMGAGAAALLVDGVRRSVDGTGADALATLVRAAALLEPAGASVLLPDSPAAVAAIVALHCGEPAIADSVLERAEASGLGGPLLTTRHLLLRAWTNLVRGRTAEAAALLGRTAAPYEPRDALFAAGLEVGLARRAADLPALAAAWRRAGEAIVRHPADLFVLLPLGELAIAAARLGDRPRIGPRLAEAFDVLAALGDPPLWANQLHWSEVHAAIVAEEPAAAREHVAALAAGDPHDHYRAVLHDAARCWVDVLDGRVDPDRVEDAARGLHGAGLCWDAARLAGQAAIRTSDRKAMVRLLDCARLLQGREARPPRPAAAPPPDRYAEPLPHQAEQPDDTAGGLSARELEVAGLAVDGLTYKEIGGRLFISAKTVEHHMARMRRKLGCDSRSELLARLRQLATVAH